jgi:hypothetical protein
MRSAERRRRSEVLGSYEPNQFIMFLDSDTPFLQENASGEVCRDLRYFHTFFHEYWHYWQNISTVSGAKSFCLSQNLVVLFSETLTSETQGTSSGSSSLSPDDAQGVSGNLDVLFDLDGSETPGDYDDTCSNQDFRINSSFEVKDVTLFRQGNSGLVEAPLHSVLLNISIDGLAETQEFKLGSIAIEESVAFLVEQQVCSAIALSALVSPSKFPYRVVEEVFRYIVKEKPSTLFIPASLGTLALLLTHPGPALVQILERYRDLRGKGLGELEALEATIKLCKISIENTIEGLINDDLPAIEAMHAGRGLLEGASKFIGKTCNDALKLRLKDPLFDLRRLWPTASQQVVEGHLQRFPSCDIVQLFGVEESPCGGLHSFLSDDVDEFNFTPSTYLRSLQAQQDFLFAHCDLDSAQFLPSSDVTSQCPFFDVCDLPHRKEKEGVCGSEPWRAYFGESEGCWYSTGVSSMLGPVRIRSRANDDDPTAVL